MKILFILLVALLFGASSSSAETITKLDILDHKNIEDSIIYKKQDGNIAIINIFSGTIGERTIKLIEGKWPASIIFRLHTGYIDEILVSKMPIGLEILNIPKKSFSKNGVPTGMKRHGWSKDHAYYEINMPKALLDKTTKEIKISWITYM